MGKMFLVVLMLLVCFALPVFGQDSEEMASEAGESMMPPPPLADEWSKFLIGEWEGWSEGPEGKSQEWEKISLGLDGQFLLREARTEMGEMHYKGHGALTRTQDGGFAGMWIDNFRGMYRGEGTADGNKLTMTWSGYHGEYSQIIEKTGEDKYVGTWKFTEAGSSKTSEGQVEMTRKKVMADK